LFIYFFINYTGFCFREGKDPRTNKEMTCISKEYLLHGFECMASLVSDHEIILNQMEQILATSVIPELSSEEGILRARACSVFSTYGGNVDIKDMNN